MFLYFYKNDYCLKKNCIFAPEIKMPCGVMVAQQILVLFVWVRILSGQQSKADSQ